MLVRPALKSDLPAIVVLQRDAIWELARLTYGEVGAAAWACWQTDTASRLLDGAGRLFVVESDRGLAGMGGWHPDAGDSDCAWVRAVFVAPHCVRQGIGRRVMAAIEESANGVSRPFLRLTASLGAQEFYAVQGYTATASRVWEVEHGVMLNCVDMQKGNRVASESPIVPQCQP